MNVLVVDVGGSHVKLRASGSDETRRFRSGKTLTPDALVQQVRSLAADWAYDVVALGYPGAVDEHGPAAEPGNLSPGWVGYDFRRAFERPVRVVNDAVMQALGAYESGRMLFLGLGTGVGSALITEHVLVPLELGSLPYAGGGTLAEHLGRAARKHYGHTVWQQTVVDVTPRLRAAMAADYVVLGGGNAQKVEQLPPHTRRGSNDDAMEGGFRLWEETVEPHDQQPVRVWRVVR
jgi:polyphosphate glucokinase